MKFTWWIYMFSQMINESLVGDSQDRHHIVIVGILYLRQQNRVASPRKGCFRFPRLPVRHRETWIPRAVVKHACNGARGTMCNNAESLSLSRRDANVYADTKIIAPNCSAVACSCKCHTRVDGAT